VPSQVFQVVKGTFCFRPDHKGHIRSPKGHCCKQSTISGGWTRSCTKYQIVELPKRSLPIDLLWWIEAAASLISK